MLAYFFMTKKTNKKTSPPSVFLTNRTLTVSLGRPRAELTALTHKGICRLHTAELGQQRCNKAVTVVMADVREADKRRKKPGQGQRKRRTEWCTDSSCVFQGHLFVSLCPSVCVGCDFYLLSSLQPNCHFKGKRCCLWFKGSGLTADLREIVRLWMQNDNAFLINPFWINISVYYFHWDCYCSLISPF